MPRIVAAACGLLFGVAAACAAVTGGADFNRYRGIIERQPFGEIVPAQLPPPATSAPSETLTRELEMRAIIDDGNNNLRVAFQDKKSSKFFYLAIGEVNEGYELVSVDYEHEEAVLKRGADSSVFSLKPKTAAAAGAAPDAPASPLARPASTPAVPGFFPPAMPGTNRPFFSDRRGRRGFSPFRPLGTNQAAPMQVQSLENFMKANPNAAAGLAGQPRPFEPFRGSGATNTLQGFLQPGSNAPRGFVPFQPPGAATAPGFAPLVPADQTEIPFFAPPQPELEEEAVEE